MTDIPPTHDFAGTLTYKTVVMPEHLNSQQTLFGGTLLSWVDLAGAIEAVSATKNRVVLASMKECNFKRPIFVGSVVEIYTKIASTGRSSLTVDAAVYISESLNINGEKHLAATATAVYVAIDGDRKPTALERS